MRFLHKTLSHWKLRLSRKFSSFLVVWMSQWRLRYSSEDPEHKNLRGRNRTGFKGSLVGRCGINMNQLSNGCQKDLKTDPQSQFLRSLWPKVSPLIFVNLQRLPLMSFAELFEALPLCPEQDQDHWRKHPTNWISQERSKRQLFVKVLCKYQACRLDKFLTVHLIGGEGAFEMVGGRALEVEVETTWKDLTHLDLEYQTLR